MPNRKRARNIAISTRQHVHIYDVEHLHVGNKEEAYEARKFLRLTLYPLIDHSPKPRQWERVLRWRFGAAATAYSSVLFVIES